jgi:nucleoside-diphosphate-sugar epimerase
MKVTITGASGFVGSNFIKYNKNLQYLITDRNGKLFTNVADVILHFAGKAHDLKSTVDAREYYKVNTELTKRVYNAFLASKAKVFITLSSVKAVADQVDGELTEVHNPEPVTHYGKSKLLAEQYIFSNPIPEGKRVYVLRPCMIHGLDELPQLLNVLIGDMSFVGPRSNLFNQVELIREGETRAVYKVRPGITGLAQIQKIDMSTPKLLAETDALMLATWNLFEYLKYILLTLFGRGFGDRARYH